MDEQLYIMGMGLDLNSKIEKAILNYQVYEKEALKADPDNGYYLAFSGGKDSIVIKDLAIKAGVKFKAWYNQTTIDQPELIYFMRKHHPDVKWNVPKENFFIRLAHRGLPTRLARWCCAEYKEQGGNGKIKVCGIRAEESARRAQNWKLWTPLRGGKWMLNPILYWSEQDVWKYIRDNNLPYPSLYDKGHRRLGCIGCPMSSRRNEEFAKYPRFKQAWMRAVDKLWKYNHGRLTPQGKPYSTDAFRDGEHLFRWWMEECDAPNKHDDECQMGLF